MTKQYTEEQIKEAHEGIESAKDIAFTENSIPLMWGRWFYEARMFKWFKKTGQEIEDICGELKKSHKTFQSYSNVYRAFCMAAGYQIEDLIEIPISILTRLRPRFFKVNRKGLPQLKVSKEAMEEWIEKAKALSISDFNIEFNQAFKQMKDPNECKHEHAKTHAYINCPDCGERIWIDPETKEPVKHWHNK